MASLLAAHDPVEARKAAVAPGADALPAAVSAILRSSGLPATSFALDVRPVDGAAPLVAWHAERSFLLASTTKVVTSLAALDLLGPAHRWKTTAYATGPLRGGRIAGDLVIAGGEVGLTANELRRWFAQMHDEGVHAIAGNIVLDDVALLHELDPKQATTTAAERSADAPTSTRADASLATSSRRSPTVESSSPTAAPSLATAHTANRTCSDSKQRSSPGRAWTRIVGSPGCHRSDASRPSSGAANATTCHCAVSTATASAAAVQVANARVSPEVRQWSSTSVDRSSITVRRGCAAPGRGAVVRRRRRGCAPA